MSDLLEKYIIDKEYSERNQIIPAFSFEDGYAGIMINHENNHEFLIVDEEGTVVTGPYNVYGVIMVCVVTQNGDTKEYNWEFFNSEFDLLYE